MSLFHTTRAKEIIANAAQNELFTAIVSDISEDAIITRFQQAHGYTTVKLEGYLEDGEFVQVGGDTWNYAMIIDNDGYIL